MTGGFSFLCESTYRTYLMALVDRAYLVRGLYSYTRGALLR